jgi:hypothetical protein
MDFQTVILEYYDTGLSAQLNFSGPRGNLGLLWQ